MQTRRRACYLLDLVHKSKKVYTTYGVRILITMAFINHVDMAGGRGFAKCPYYYISFIK